MAVLSLQILLEVNETIKIELLHIVRPSRLPMPSMRVNGQQQRCIILTQALLADPCRYAAKNCLSSALSSLRERIPGWLKEVWLQKLEESARSVEQWADQPDAPSPWIFIQHP